MRLLKLNTITFPAFVKPADDKCFPAGVYHSQSEIPGINLLEETTPILTSEPVRWDVEFRAFNLEGWAIIEANPSWSSGVYGCDPTAVLRTIIRGCRHRRKLRSEDTRWIISR